MRIHSLTKLFLFFGFLPGLIGCGGQGTALKQTETVDSVLITAGELGFAEDVLPIFENSCTRCHGSSRQSGGLRLDSYAALMAGGMDGAVIVPGDAPSSRLVEMITSGEMPKNAAALPDEEIQVIIKWVDAGAMDN